LLPLEHLEARPCLERADQQVQVAPDSANESHVFSAYFAQIEAN
jgi:hypothetical protein